MDERRKQNKWYQSGGSGKLATWTGRAERWWVHHALTSVPRLMMVTHLAAHGETTLAQLEAIANGDHSTTYMQVRSMVRQGLLEWRLEVVSRPTAHRAGQRLTMRVVSITDLGRRWLWRSGLLAERLLYSPMGAPPIRDDVPENPVDAIATWVRREFLRPSAMALLDELSLFGPNAMRELGRWTGNPLMTLAHLRRWRRLGLAGKWGRMIAPFDLIGHPRWGLTDEGKLALARHVDAFRRVAERSGYEPRECDWLYPMGALSECAALPPDQPPEPCADCLYRWSGGYYAQGAGLNVSP